MKTPPDYASAMARAITALEARIDYAEGTMLPDAQSSRNLGVVAALQEGLENDRAALSVLLGHRQVQVSSTLDAIGERLRTQDNRATYQPMFCVQIAMSATTQSTETTTAGATRTSSSMTTILTLWSPLAMTGKSLATWTGGRPSWWRSLRKGAKSTSN